MATIVVFGAGGRIGSRIVIEAAERSHQVTAVTQEGTARDLPGGVTAARGDATSRDSTAALAQNADVLVSAVGGPDKSVYLRVAHNLVETAAGLGTGGPRIFHSGAETHTAHDHEHGPDCGHASIKHDDHIDYFHDGHVHRAHDGHRDECTLTHAHHVDHADHEHGLGCGHTTVVHGDHVDYVHDGHRHAAHEGHWDEH